MDNLELRLDDITLDEVPISPPPPPTQMTLEQLIRELPTDIAREIWNQTYEAQYTKLMRMPFRQQVDFLLAKPKKWWDMFKADGRDIVEVYGRSVFPYEYINSSCVLRVRDKEWGQCDIQISANFNRYDDGREGLTCSFSIQQDMHGTTSASRYTSLNGTYVFHIKPMPGQFNGRMFTLNEAGRGIHRFAWPLMGAAIRKFLPQMMAEARGTRFDTEAIVDYVFFTFESNVLPVKAILPYSTGSQANRTSYNWHTTPPTLANQEAQRTPWLWAARYDESIGMEINRSFEVDA